MLSRRKCGGTSKYLHLFSSLSRKSSELHQAFDHFDVDRDCRSIVLSGNGPSFCAGIDLKLGFAALLQTMQERSTDAARRAFAIRDLIKRYQDSFTVTSSGAPRKSAPSLQSLERCRKPVIVAIHSHCLGAATSLITAADVRFASSDAQMSVKVRGARKQTCRARF